MVFVLKKFDFNKIAVVFDDSKYVRKWVVTVWKYTQPLKWWQRYKLDKRFVAYLVAFYFLLQGKLHMSDRLKYYQTKLYSSSN